jgi:peptide chain release factor subunit 1
VFGVDDTLKALDMGAVETLIVWENLETIRVELKNKATGEDVIAYMSPEEEADPKSYRDDATGAELEAVDKNSLVDWFTVNYKARAFCSVLAARC